jgi:hypothetical protein
MKKFEGEDKNIIEIREKNKKEIFDEDEYYFKKINGVFE